MNTIKVVFHAEYEKSSASVNDVRVFKVAMRKIEFIRSVGLQYPSLNAKRLHDVMHEGSPVWEFYISKKWRCLFVYQQEIATITVLKICNHL